MVQSPAFSRSAHFSSGIRPAAYPQAQPPLLGAGAPATPRADPHPRVVCHNCSSSTCNLKKAQYRKRDSLARLIPSACKSVLLTPSWLQQKATSAYSRWTSRVLREENHTAKRPTVQRRFLFCILVFLSQHDLLCKRKNSQAQPQVYRIPTLKPAELGAANLCPSCITELHHACQKRDGSQNQGRRLNEPPEDCSTSSSSQWAIHLSFFTKIPPTRKFCRARTFLQLQPRPQVPTRQRMVPHAQPHWKHWGMKDAWWPLPHLCLHQQYQDLSQGKRIHLIAQSNTSEAVAHISSVTSQGTECHQIAIRSNLCPNKIHGKVAIVDFRLAQFKLQCTWDVTTGFPLLHILSPKYEFILSYRTRTQRTLKKKHTPPIETDSFLCERPNFLRFHNANVITQVNLQHAPCCAKTWNLTVHMAWTADFSLLL